MLAVVHVGTRRLHPPLPQNAHIHLPLSPILPLSLPVQKTVKLDGADFFKAKVKQLQALMGGDLKVRGNAARW